MVDPKVTALTRSRYDAYAARYDSETIWYERAMLGNGRAWASAQARGDVLEVALGTGLNLAHYPGGIRLTGLELSSEMLRRAVERAGALRLEVGLVQGDAQRLPFSDATFDTVVCTLALSSIPDDRAAVGEMYRVLRPGGCLILLGHVASPYRLVRAAQRAVERLARERSGDRQTRSVLPLVRQQGFVVGRRRTFRFGVIERLTAVKPVQDRRRTV
jgi:ubiquinone/menaquinone biosynthesis C-methylase UbiE